MNFLRFIFLFPIAILLGTTAYSENENISDSLISQLQEQNHDTTNIYLYWELSRYYMQSNPDSALLFANQGLYLAKKIEHEVGIGDMYITLGHIKVIQNDLFQAMNYYLKAAGIFSNSNFKNKLTIANLVLGNVFFTLGNYPAALDYYQKGVVIADSLNLTTILPDFYNNLGELYSKLKDYDAAIENFNKGLIIREDANDNVGAAYIAVNLARMFIRLDDFDKANTYLEEAHQLYEKISHNEGLSNVSVVYASLERKRNNYSKAIEYYKEGFEYFNQIGSEYLGPKSILKADLQSNIGICYLETQNYTLAEKNLLEANEIAEKTGQLEYLQNTSKYLSELYETINQPVKALKYARSYKTYSDSISKDENIKELTQLEMQFEFDKKLKENVIEQTEIKAKQKRKELIYIMISSSIFLALIILFLLFRLQQYKVKKMNLERQNLLFDLDYKNKELTTNVMYLLKKNEFIINVSDKLKKSRYNFKPENRKVVDDIIRELEISSSEDIWKDFEVRFQEVHADFYQELIHQFPDLSPNELKLCAFLRLNMSTKEISTITFQSHKSISMARFRLRKKMGIDSSENLVTFLSQL